MHLTVSAQKDSFIYRDKKVFLLADTLWTAFSNITRSEWLEYLAYRKAQGFNAIQTNILYQWDSGDPDLGRYPFAQDENGRFDFYRFNTEYFEHARWMVETAYNEGFILMLTVLWGSYVADTWISKNYPQYLMPLDAIKPYCEFVVKTFSQFHPIYIISGDTNFESEETSKYYLTAMETIKSLSPDALTTMHLCPPHDLPDHIVSCDRLDFYMYQSGHNIEHQKFNYEMGLHFYNKPVKRPIMNGEPCYESHSYGICYGRHNAFHVRKAIWQSVLSGAKAGVTYGAHGVWGWYSNGKQFINEGYGGRPLEWRDALRLPGAWDAAFVRWLFESFDLFTLEPSDKVLNETQEIRMAVSPDTCQFVLYVPYNIDIEIAMDLREYEITVINLENKSIARPTLEYTDKKSTIKMHPFNTDVLIMGKKNAGY